MAAPERVSTPAAAHAASHLVATGLLASRAVAGHSLYALGLAMAFFALAMVTHGLFVALFRVLTTYDDAEQIEGIISMIGDMGIQVFDQAPDAESLLISETTPAAAGDDVEEEAEAAVSTLDSEFGRTTDPVRMYMREMGSVER